MTGLTPVPFVALNMDTAPAMDPWSVSPTAGISNSAARAASSGIRHAPSRMEYSLWTCRWTNGAVSTDALRGLSTDALRGLSTDALRGLGEGLAAGTGGTGYNWVRTLPGLPWTWLVSVQNRLSASRELHLSGGHADEPVDHRVVPDGEPRAVGPPRFHRLGVGARASRDPLEELARRGTGVGGHVRTMVRLLSVDVLLAGSAGRAAPRSSCRGHGSDSRADGRSRCVSARSSRTRPGTSPGTPRLHARRARRR